MVGKVQDVMSAMVVIGAADKAGKAVAKRDKPTPLANESRNTVEKAADLQDQWNANPKSVAKSEDKREQAEPMDEHSVSLLTKELNELMDKINCDLKFTYHKEVDLMSVQMINKKTDEVLKEFPPEDMIENMSKAKEWIGAFIDRNA